MFLPFMKALWHGERDHMCWASLRASALVRILANVWMRLIGRKSITHSDPYFFGMSVIFALLRRLRLPQRKLWKELTTAITSL
jgi:hypothetical protein